MSWLRRYKLRHYVRNSVWVLPFCGLAAGLGSVRILHWIEQSAGWQSAFNPEGARALFGTLAGAMFTFIVFLASMLLLVLQIASAQLTPRIIGIVFQDRVIRCSLTLFAFTFTFTLAVLLRINASVPALTAQVSSWLCVLSIGIFLFLIDHLGKALRPSGALHLVGRLGHEVIQSVYPRSLAEQGDVAPGPALATGAEPSCIVLSPKDGVFLAFDLPGLMAQARASDCVIELTPQVGDFVSAGSPLFRIFGGKSAPAPSVLWQSVALGQERTMEQDPAFAFRIIVDVASKGLSPAINDPTTAVLAIDQIHHLLRSVGGRHLNEGLAYDRSGALRLVYPTPNWADFVSLAVTEIRHFGGTSIQVARRLRAMLENLIEILPAERRALLHHELRRLQRSIERSFPEPEDQGLADVSDSQGMGGKHAESTERPTGVSHQDAS